MGLNSLQAVCMDSTDKIQGTMVVVEELATDSSLNSPSGEILASSRQPSMEKRLKAQHEQAPNCPRCDSTNTKFCYYNNYSLSQPRYFCKTCRRYWTKGGILRNVPVGGRCRKNKKPSSRSKKSSPSSSSSSTNIHQKPHLDDQNSIAVLTSENSVIDLPLCFPAEVQLSHLSSFGGINNLMESKYNTIISMLENSSRSIDFLDSKFDEGIMGNIMSGARSHDFVTNGNDFGIVHGVEDWSHHGVMNSIGGFCSPFGASLHDHGNDSSASLMGNLLQTMLPYDHGNEPSAPSDAKFNSISLNLQWQEQGCIPEHEDEKSPFGCTVDSLASWSGNGIVSGYGT
ncbi:hypothetical protein Droror1_Dr00021283 [Drosera rotundifolia]